MDIPHCPNPDCPYFSTPPAKKWYVHYGYHHTRTFGTVQRYRCTHCGKTFSTQTFHIDYYAKKIIDYQAILDQLATSSGMNDISRSMNVRVESIENRIERLARCALMIQGDLLSTLPMEEDLVADGFETFSYSQYFPTHVNVVAGRSSEFIYSLGFSNLRRKGRMTADQKRRRAALEAVEKANPKAVEHSMYRLFDDLTERLTRKGIKKTTVYTDEHRAYVRAFRKITGFLQRCSHRRINSKDERLRREYLFAVDYVDRQFRKDLSDHVRETVKFAKCPSAMMARLAVYRYFHNCIIPRRICESRKGNLETHTEHAGLTGNRLAEVTAKHWGRRPFLHKCTLGAEELKTWLCAWRNPGIPYGRYIPKYIRI